MISTGDRRVRASDEGTLSARGQENDAGPAGAVTRSRAVGADAKGSAVRQTRPRSPDRPRFTLALTLLPAGRPHPVAEPRPDAYGVTEAAARLGLSEKTVRRLIHRGILPGRRAGDRVLVPADSLERWLRGEEPPARSVCADGARRSRTPGSSISRRRGGA